MIPRAKKLPRFVKRGQEVIGVGMSENARLQLNARRFDSTLQDIRFSWQATLPSAVGAHGRLSGGFVQRGFVSHRVRPRRCVCDLQLQPSGADARRARENGAVFVDYAIRPMLFRPHSKRCDRM